MSLLNSRTLNLFVISLLCGGVIVFLLKEAVEIKAQRNYEEAFLSQYREIINQHNLNPSTEHVIRLAIPAREREHLLDLCELTLYRWGYRYDENVRNLEAYQPRIEVHFVAFRRLLGLRLSAVRTEMVRCSETIAIVDSGDGLSGFVLGKDQSRRSNRRNYPLFHIYRKFYYNRSRRLELINLATPVDQEPPNRVQISDRDTEQTAAA